MSENTISLINSEEIKNLLPQADNMVLVDVICQVNTESIQGIKNVAMTEHFLEGHFPNESMMPGVLILESMIQLANLLILIRDDSKKGYYSHLKKVVDIKFKEKVKPGDQLLITVTSLERLKSAERFKGVVKVDNKIVTAGVFELIGHTK
ncbi:3-hydroxyacyl-ACP dehydratase FabZ [Jeotgalibacillus proteolyticus]|uniref:3-hydroxyacyl-[acyl-carrier-protein] dehydratase FabZ n=1 Tax=Jeotgalibacillus proteolyticus TaxID=2082395 RepID=A0A2S5G788_9BACL|nr:3-hydroxyacyl-ACP dehydratase FabZ [Jeotgalibacillus proteolyticus]PPA68717.1 hypothetical protein C4B60_19295 [Jeotgalibacillus proteolyticus]PPA68794.1 hypothetical protein C4B60_19725 [Jeotgalibacillus proteolyticus]